MNTFVLMLFLLASALGRHVENGGITDIVWKKDSSVEYPPNDKPVAKRPQTESVAVNRIVGNDSLESR